MVNDFAPRYLMIKQHRITGLKYFCMTTQAYFAKYKGSGRYWKDHLKAHGKLVDTIWVQYFTDKDDIMEFALFFSDFYDIIKSKNKNGDKVWANEIPEDGIQGGQNRGLSDPGITFYGRKHTPESKKLMTLSGNKNGMFGKSHTEESINLMKQNRPNQTRGNNPCARKCHTPIGDFECVMDAAEAMRISDTTLRKRLQSSDEKFEEYYYEEIK